MARGPRMALDDYTRPLYSRPTVMINDTLIMHTCGGHIVIAPDNRHARTSRSRQGLNV